MQILNILTRIFLSPDRMESAIAFYENLCGKKCNRRFTYSEAGLELAQVDRFLLIAGSDEKLEPFKSTQITLFVDDIEEYLKYLKQAGAGIMSEPKVVPTGKNMRVKHPDGIIAEYVEHYQ